MEIFGWELTKKRNATRKQNDPNVMELAPDRRDDAITLSGAGGHVAHYLDAGEDSIQSENELILRYREVAMLPEVDQAVSDIVDQAIASSDDGTVVKINLDHIDLSDNIKKKIAEEFENVLRLLNFRQNAPDIFRDWYIDGKIYFQLVPDKVEKNGIRSVRQIDPLFVKKAKEVETVTDQNTKVTYDKTVNEFYLVQPNNTLRHQVRAGDLTSMTTEALRVAKDMIAAAPSGQYNIKGTRTVSYLHKALKAANQLSKLEDSLVIYRIARAPERRIFYIDVGNMNKGKAEQYVQGLMNKYRNKLVYDASTGDIRDDRRAMSMLEDFWLPRKEGGKGTEITTLSGGENLGQIEDVLFFRKKLYRSLNVPMGRLEAENTFNVGRATEINRDEVKFQKFIDRIRKKFSRLFYEILRMQLLLKKVITDDEWDMIEEDIILDFTEDNYFSELKEFEILRERLELASQAEEFVGKHFSQEWMRKTIFKMSDSEIEAVQKQITAEKKSGDIEDDEDFET